MTLPFVRVKPALNNKSGGHFLCKKRRECHARRGIAEGSEESKRKVLRA